MGKLDIKSKVTKIVRGEIKAINGKFMRRLDFFNGDLNTFSIILKADSEDALKLKKVVEEEEDDEDEDDDDVE